jgi:hypothetical protein
MDAQEVTMRMQKIIIKLDSILKISLAVAKKASRLFPCSSSIAILLYLTLKKESHHGESKENICA